MPKSKRTTAQPAAEPKPTAEAPQSQAEPTIKPNLTSLLKKCFRFDADAPDESRQLLSDILERFESSQRDTTYSFNVIAAEESLRTLGVHIGVDALEVPTFLELLNLFAQAVSGWGYGGFRERLISRLLTDIPQSAAYSAYEKRGMNFEWALTILVQEFQEMNSNIEGARQALKQYPDQLADAMKKAMEASPELREKIFGVRN